jgi:hypothetical protein
LISEQLNYGSLGTFVCGAVMISVFAKAQETKDRNGDFL